MIPVLPLAPGAGDPDPSGGAGGEAERRPALASHALILLRRLGPVLALIVLSLSAGCDDKRESFSEEDRVRFEAAWRGFLGAVEIADPSVDLGLLPGASEGSLDEFEGFVGRVLPEDFRELYRRADGQEGQAFALFPGYRFLPLEEAKANWEMMKHPMLRVLGLLPLGDNHPSIRNRGYHLGWIPLAENGAGDFLCVDLVPSSRGVRGQVIEFVHDDTPRSRRALGVTDYFERMARDLKEGDLVVYRPWLTLLSPDEVPEVEERAP